MILLVFMMGASSCTTGITFNPDWHVGDSHQMAIVPEEGPVVMCEAERFNNFACMHREKVKELKIILQNARIPKKDKEKILKALEINR
jgi:hypothetical protein